MRASAFARAINRTLAPGVQSPGVQHTGDIVGAAAVQAGRATSAAGVGRPRRHARGPSFTRPVLDFAGEDDRVGLLRRPTDSPRGPGRSRGHPRSRPVLREGVSAGREGGYPAQPVLPRQAAAPCRRLRRRPSGELPARSARPGRARRSGLGVRARARLLPAGAAVGRQVRPQQIPVLRQAGVHSEAHPLQRLAAAVSEQPEVAPRGELRSEPASAGPGCRHQHARRAAHRPVPAIHAPWFQGRRRLPAQACRSSSRKGPRPRKHARR